ncbi:AMP-binding protein [Rhodococcus sp. TAF43]|uniref:AMP-binding protein n=1 Tax=Rhodococcus sp. TAF43 TaxID=3237483 RepID=UPI003F95B599
MLAVTVAAHGPRPAILDAGVSFTYNQFDQRVRDTAFTLQGVKAGDRVAIVLPNCWEYAVTYFA